MPSDLFSKVWRNKAWAGALWLLPLTAVWFWLGLGCSSNNTEDNFNYLRSASDFSVDTARADTLCDDPNSPFGTDVDLCKKTKKFVLRWERPEDTADFQGYRVYLDTTPPIAPKSTPWKTVRTHPEWASLIITAVSKQKDGIVFYLTDKISSGPDTINENHPDIIGIDSTARSHQDDITLSEGKFVFGLMTQYGGGKTQGEPRYTFLVTTDNQPPDVFNVGYAPGAKSLTVTWPRPTDHTSFFNSSLDSGAILGYFIQLSLGGKIYAERQNNFHPRIHYFRGPKELPVTFDSTVVSAELPPGHVYFLPDSNHAHKGVQGPQDSLRVVFENLTPQDTLDVFLFAVDSSKNSNQNAMQKVRIRLTDTTEPSAPKLVLDSGDAERNTMIIHWTASRDSMAAGDGTIGSGPSPNWNIQQYKLSRTLIRGNVVSSKEEVDTVINITNANSGDSEFIDTVRFLPPGTPFFIRVSAVDSSGFESKSDTMTVSTAPVRFTGADSALVCPTGMIPIPSGHFTFGDDSPVAQNDEKPSRQVNMGSYCIEPYEHRDSTGAFVSDVSWSEAAAICKGIDSSFNTQLCSEVEWERACEGPDTALAHGIQSEGKNASILQSSCNQGTNDSAMAMSFDLRNKTCLTSEGVYDMAGNFSEWVRDPYVEHPIPVTDTLTHGFSFADTAGAMQRFGFRGGNYLKPNLPLSSIQNLARCSNRDFAEQIRPSFRSDCIDSLHPTRPKIAIIYGPGLTGHRCIDVPDSLLNSQISDLAPAPKDTNKIFAFLPGVSDPKPIQIPTDTMFKGRKPISAQLTKLALAVVTFEKPGSSEAPIPDTLDASEMRDTSQATLAKIFSREAGNSGWTVHSENGAFVIKWLFSYNVIATKPAKPYYSNRAIGFRCCSLAKLPAPTPKPIAKRFPGERR